MPSRARPRPALLWGALVTIYLVWGSTYLGMRIALDSIPPFAMAGIRYSLAGALMLMYVFARGGRPRRSEWLGALVTGGLLIAVGNGGVVWGEQYISTGVAAIIVSTSPLWIALLSRLWLAEPLSWPVGVGLGIGFCGLLVLVGPAALVPGDLRGYLAVLLAAVGWSAGTVASKRLPLARDPLLASGMQMLMGGLVVGVLSLVTGDAGHLHLAAITVRSALAFLWLLFFGAIVGFGVFLWLVKNAPLPLVSTYAYVNPVVAVVLGVLILGEPLTTRTLVGGGVIVAGIAIIVAAQALAQRRENRQRAADAALAV